MIERGPVELADAALLLSLLAALPHQPTVAARGLEALFEQRGAQAWIVEQQPTVSH